MNIEIKSGYNLTTNCWKSGHSMKSDTKSRARQRLDERLQPLKPVDRFRSPPKGWLRAIRDALGMTGVQFAGRLGIRPQSVEALERSEANGAIQLKTLRRAAALLQRCWRVGILREFGVKGFRFSCWERIMPFKLHS